MNQILLVAIGGALGSVGRYLTGQFTLRAFGPGFPWGTLTVNLLGSLAIGFMVELIARKFNASHELRLFIVTGFLGGFTTFSAFSLDVTLLVDHKQMLLALIYIAATVLVSLFAVFGGLALGRAIL
jgi:CrcB protein